MNRLLTSRLAAHGHARQVEAALATDAIGAAADRAVGSVWRRLLEILRTARDVGAAQHHARAALEVLLPSVRHAMTGGFVRLALQSHRLAARALVQTLPGPYLERAVKGMQNSHTLTEDFARDAPGLVHLAITGQDLVASDRLASIREPAPHTPGDEEVRALIERLLFPSPAAERVESFIRRMVIGGETWEQRLAKASPPWSLPLLASTLAAGYAAGKTQREIAQDLLPVVDGVRSSARRLARTYGMAVAHQTQMETAHQLGDLVVGYQVHATLDQWTRPEHRHRDGTIYYKDPGPGQKGMNECPHPPLEADGKCAWNCRCYLTPVLAPASELQTDGPRRSIFTQAQGRLVPDPITYRDWFQRADVRRQKLSVGVQRYNTAAEVLGRAPHYEELVGFDGQLLGLTDLRSETPIQRAERVAKVRVEMLRRAEDIRQVATFGFAK